MAKQFSAQIFMETSAKQGINIDELFEKIGRKIKEKIEKSTPSALKIQKPVKVPGKGPNDQNLQSKTNTSTITNQTTKNGKIKLKNDETGGKKKKNCQC